MKLNKKQTCWLKRHCLPKGYTPLDVIPRAYCVLKPAPGMAVFATPWQDYRPHLAKEEQKQYQAGVHIHATFSEDLNQAIYNLNTGDWATIVYASGDRCAEWFCAPKLMPFSTFKEKK